MGILFWRGRVSKSGFRRQFMSLVRERLPQVALREADEDGELSLEVSGLPDGRTLIQRLDNAYQEFKAKPDTRDAIYQRWCNVLLDLIEPPPLERAKFLPFVKSREWLCELQAGTGAAPGAGEELFHDVLNDELVVCYVNFSDASIHFVKRKELETLGLDAAGARELALRNLRARTAERTFMDFPAGWSVHVGGNFEATLLVDDELWSDARFRGADWVFMAAPDRNTLLTSIDASVHGVWTLAFMASMLAQSESYPISSRVFVRRDGRFDLLDPLLEDPEHPIPRLDVIDVSVESNRGEHVAIVIASPLDATPRSIYRLFWKLEGYLSHLDCDGSPARLAVPRERRPRIDVVIHPGSDPDVLHLLDSIDDYVGKRGALLGIERRG